MAAASIAIGISGPEGAASAEIVGRRFFGHDQLVELRLGSGQTIRSRRLGFPAWHPGDRVRAWVDGPTDVLAREERDGDLAAEEAGTRSAALGVRGPEAG